MKQYRNTVNILSLQDIWIDAFSLWEKRGNLMVLVDEDQYISAPYSAKLFEEA